jgi:hypothetical protein
MAHLMRQHLFKLGDDIGGAPTRNRNLRTVDADCSVLTRVAHLEDARDCACRQLSCRAPARLPRPPPHPIGGELPQLIELPA